MLTLVPGIINSMASTNKCIVPFPSHAMYTRRLINYSETRTLCGYSSFRDESYSSHDKNIGFGLYCVYGGARVEPG